jgi:hypothetical protein
MPLRKRQEYKKCCIRKAPRHPTLLVGHTKKFQGVTIDRDGQVLVQLESGITVKADAVLSQTGYTKKDGKEKVLTSIPKKKRIGVSGLHSTLKT